MSISSVAIDTSCQETTPGAHPCRENPRVPIRRSSLSPARQPPVHRAVRLITGVSSIAPPDQSRFSSLVVSWPFFANRQVLMTCRSGRRIDRMCRFSTARSKCFARGQRVRPSRRSQSVVLTSDQHAGRPVANARICGASSGGFARTPLPAIGFVLEFCSPPDPAEALTSCRLCLQKSTVSQDMSIFYNRIVVL